MKGYRRDSYGTDGGLVGHRGIFQLVRDNGSRGEPAVQDETPKFRKHIPPKRKPSTVAAKVEKALREAGGREVRMKELYAFARKSNNTQVIEALNRLYELKLIWITNAGAKWRTTKA